MNLELLVREYINRYAPSEHKLRDYLSRKNHTLDTSGFISKIGYSENLMADLWLRTFLSQGISERKIREKLLRKQFPKSLIEEKIRSNALELRDWGSYKGRIDSRIDEYLRKGKSKKYISQILTILYPYFRDELSLLLEEKDDSEMLRVHGEKYLLKYDITDLREKQKFYSALMRKGFSYDDIHSFLKLR